MSMQRTIVKVKDKNVPFVFPLNWLSPFPYVQITKQQSELHKTDVA